MIVLLQRQLGDYAVHSGLRMEDIGMLLSDDQALIDAAKDWLEYDRPDQMPGLDS